MSWKERILKDAPDRKVAIIGDIMLDRYLHGTIDRISPEAPVPVVRLRESSNMLGGAANVASNIRGLGAATYLFGVTGQDSYGDVVASLLDNMGIEQSGVIRTPSKPTTAKTRIMSHSQHVLRVDDEETGDVDESIQDQLLQAVLRFVINDRPDVVIMPDYNKGLLTREVIAGLMTIMRDHRIPVAVDPKDRNFFEYLGADIFKPNLREINAQLPYEVLPTIESLDNASRHLRDKLQHNLTCITLSDNGIYMDDGKSSGIYPTNTQEIVDVCGAGDAVISIIVLARLAGLNMAELAMAGNYAGGIVCSHPGVTALSLDLLNA